MHRDFLAAAMKELFESGLPMLPNTYRECNRYKLILQRIVERSLRFLPCC